MSADHELLQRYHDGEATRAQAVGAERLLADQPALRAQAQRLDALDQIMHEHAQISRAGHSTPSGLVQAAMQRLPNRVPRRQVRLSVGQMTVATLALAGIIIGSLLTERLRSVMPADAVALISVLAGVALVLAARPLLQIEASLFSRLMRRRLAVGDGDVLVCRVLGIALLIGGSHVVGLWG
jgi:anti-sigma factor RsiW